MSKEIVSHKHKTVNAKRQTFCPFVLIYLFCMVLVDIGFYLPSSLK
jgi:hypothetical protein